MVVATSVTGLGGVADGVAQILSRIYMNYPHPILAKEGWPFIAGSLVLAVAASFAGLWSLPMWVIFIFCLQNFAIA